MVLLTAVLLSGDHCMSKSNIIVFRNGGYLSAREHWSLDGNVMPVVNVYKYLGIYFSTRLSFSFTCKDLASRAKNALICIMQRLSMLDNSSLSVFLKLFDCQVQPMVQYGAELWGLYNSVSHCEKLHLYALKKFLGVSLQTPNDLVYSETGRYPIAISSAIRSIRYCLKLTRMNALRLPKKAYNMLYNLDGRCKMNWVTKVRMKLYDNGFDHVWMNQGVEDINGFIDMFRKRLIDRSWQNVNEHMENSDRFSFYRQFNTAPFLPAYIHMNMDRHLKWIMTRFRIGVSELAVHHYRYRFATKQQMLCPLCKTCEENELHFVLVCPFYSHLREKFISFKYYRQPCLFRLVLLIASRNETCIKNFANFVYRALKLRNTLMS